jgi:pyridoxal phosphate enzyme (YggS family)
VAGSTDWRQQLRANLARVRSSIAEASQRRGRDPHTVRLVAVTKYVAPPVLREVLLAGVSDVGENHVQQLVARARECGPPRLDWPDLGEPADARPRWHMIGHLQRNKVRPLLQYARIVHSLDSPRLAQAIEQQAAAFGARVDVLIEVNVAGEASKTGLSPDEVAPLVETVAVCSHLCLRGLMTMAPYDPDPEAARSCFVRLRELLGRFRCAKLVGPDCVHLSMGMSQDYAVAVEEGATLVRVGSALFDGLPSLDPRRTR